MSDTSRIRCRAGAPGEPNNPIRCRLQCDERNRTAPPPGRIHSIWRRLCFRVKDIVAYSSAAEQRHIPRLAEQNTSRIAIIAYCRVFPPRGQRFPRYSRAFDCCIALGGIYGECGRVVWAAASCNRRIKSAHQFDPGARSVLLRGRPRRVQIKASRETSTAYEGDTVAAGPPAAGG